jgi:hypothetical protein
MAHYHRTDSLGLGDYWRFVMPLSRFLQGRTFGPDEIVVMTKAFEGALRALDLVDRTDPAADMVAKKIIELANQGEHDPVRLCARAVEALTGKPPNAA